MEEPRAGSPPAGPWSTCILGFDCTGCGRGPWEGNGNRGGRWGIRGPVGYFPEPGNILEKLKTGKCVSPFVSLLFPFLSPNYYICWAHSFWVSAVGRRHDPTWIRHSPAHRRWVSPLGSLPFLLDLEFQLKSEGTDPHWTALWVKAGALNSDSQPCPCSWNDGFTGPLWASVSSSTKQG